MDGDPAAEDTDPVPLPAVIALFAEVDAIVCAAAPTLIRGARHRRPRSRGVPVSGGPPASRRRGPSNTAPARPVCQRRTQRR